MGRNQKPQLPGADDGVDGAIGEFRTFVHERVHHVVAEIEVAVSVVCLDQSYDDTIRRLKGNIKEQFKASRVGQKNTTGFTLGFTPDEVK